MVGVWLIAISPFYHRTCIGNGTPSVRASGIVKPSALTMRSTKKTAYPEAIGAQKQGFERSVQEMFREQSWSVDTSPKTPMWRGIHRFGFVNVGRLAE